MAARRGRSQARRNNGGNSDGIPGWAWMVLGVLLTVVVIIVAPKYLKSDGDGFFRPQPNPDAQPAPVTGDEEAVAPEDGAAAPKADAGKAGAGRGRRAREPKPAPEYEFYDLLPGKEVPLSDAELAASERAEAQRQAARRTPPPAPTAAQPKPAQVTAPARPPLPAPVDHGDEGAPAGPPAQVAAAAPAGPRTRDTTAAEGTSGATNGTPRYLLQAGAFQASGQAEELKARIALLGLGARVEAAQMDGKTLYRVRLGPYGTASDLADAKRTLAAGGVAAMAIRLK